jgi:putative transposase
MVIWHATWLYLRFALGYREVWELSAERGLADSYEAVRRLVLKFGRDVVALAGATLVHCHMPPAASPA